MEPTCGRDKVQIKRDFGVVYLNGKTVGLALSPTDNQIARLEIYNDKLGEAFEGELGYSNISEPTFTMLVMKANEPENVVHEFNGVRFAAPNCCYDTGSRIVFDTLPFTHESRSIKLADQLPKD